MSRKKGFKIPGVSFSAKRALGITKAKRKIARASDIPTTRAGRQRKAGKAMGCMTLIVGALSLIAVIIAFAI
jgi:hypothetical protein